MYICISNPNNNTVCHCPHGCTPTSHVAIHSYSFNVPLGSNGQIRVNLHCHVRDAPGEHLWVVCWRGPHVCGEVTGYGQHTCEWCVDEDLTSVVRSLAMDSTLVSGVLTRTSCLWWGHWAWAAHLGVVCWRGPHVCAEVTGYGQHTWEWCVDEDLMSVVRSLGMDSTLGSGVLTRTSCLWWGHWVWTAHLGGVCWRGPHVCGEVTGYGQHTCEWCVDEDLVSVVRSLGMDSVQRKACEPVKRRHTGGPRGRGSLLTTELQRREIRCVLTLRFQSYRIDIILQLAHILQYKAFTDISHNTPADLKYHSLHHLEAAPILPTFTEKLRNRPDDLKCLTSGLDGPITFTGILVRVRGKERGGRIGRR